MNRLKSPSLFILSWSVQINIVSYLSIYSFSYLTLFIYIYVTLFISKSVQINLFSYLSLYLSLFISISHFIFYKHANINEMLSISTDTFCIYAIWKPEIILKNQICTKFHVKYTLFGLTPTVSIFTCRKHLLIWVHGR